MGQLTGGSPVFSCQPTQLIREQSPNLLGIKSLLTTQFPSFLIQDPK